MKRDLAPTPIHSAGTRISAAPSEEALVADTRAGLSPAQMVERKLVSLLKSNALPVSQVQKAAGPIGRGRSR